jgi:hypothetical protein
MSRRQILWLTAIVCALSRLAAVARSLWDWDELQFCLAMRDFDITLHHPHPPGFPVYIGAAKLIRLFVDSDFRALQAINIIASMLVFPAVYLLAREIGMRFETALVAGVLFAFFPNVWFYGGTAFSDVPSVVLVVFAVVFLLRGRESRRDYWTGTLLLALAIGMRPQNLLVGLFPGILAMRRRPFRDSVVALLIGVIVVGAAFGAAIHATGAFEAFRKSIREHNDYIWRVDSFLNPDRPPLWRIADRFFLKQYQSPVLSFVLSIFVIISLAGAIRARDRNILYAALTFGPFAIMAWVMLDRFSINRFSIGYAPMFALLAADGMRRVAAERPVRELVLGGVVAAGAALWAFPAFHDVRSSVSPPVKAVEAAKTAIDPAQHQLFAGYSMTPFLDYLAPGLPYLRMLDDRGLPITPAPHPYLIAEVTDTTPEGALFIRERGRLWNIARRHYFEVLFQPLRNAAAFGEGWFPPEREGIVEWRWIAPRALARLPPTPSQKMLLRLDFVVPAEVLQHHPTLSILLNGRLVGTVAITGPFNIREYEVRGSTDPSTLELRVDKSFQGRSLRVRMLSWGPG